MNRSLAFLVALVAGGLIAAPAQASPAADARRALQQAEALLGPSDVGGGGAGIAATAAGPRAALSASAILRDLAVGLPELSGAERRRAIALLQRPDEAGDLDSLGKEAAVSPLCDSRFCIHWSSSKKQAPSDAGSQADGIPDYIDAVADAAATSYAVENQALGWRDAKADGTKGSRKGAGGDGQVDVYVTSLGKGLFGYATPDIGERGRSRAGYLVIDNDYKGFGGTPINLMRVTMAHEYNHILQFAYDTFEDVWMFESTATWAEDQVYPEIDDYLNFLPSFANASTNPLATTDDRDQKIYGSAVWNHWLSGRYGTGLIRDAWANSPQVQPADFAVAAYESAIDAAGGPSFSEEFVLFAATTAEWNSSTAFPDAASYPEMKRRGKLGKPAKKLKLDHTAYRLLNVPAKGDGTLTLSAKVELGTRSGIALVGRTGPAAGGVVEIVSDYSDEGGKLSVELPAAESFDRITAALINADGRLQGSGRVYKADSAAFKAKLTPTG